MKRYISTDNEQTVSYGARCDFRETKLMEATMNFVDYFIGLGDQQAVAEEKVSQLSTEVCATLYAYVLGNRMPLIDGINASTLPFMDANAKAFIIADLI